MSARPGPRNLISDVPGITVGNAEDWDALSGVTVLLPESRPIAAADVRGGAPGTRETDALAPENLVDAIDAVVLSGGSVFGLDAAGAVTAELAERGCGFSRPDTAIVAPIVPGAILFDLNNGGSKTWGAEPPYRRLGREALNAARPDFALGNVGAGLGARAGAYKGGLGSASIVTDDGLIVGALVAANPVGSPLIPGTRTFWAWRFEQQGELGRQPTPTDWGTMDLDWPLDTKVGDPRALMTRASTTIGIVATNAMLTSAEVKRVAIMAQDGYAHACRPIHTAVDGDVVFALATGQWRLPEPRPLFVSRIGMLAADCAARALARGVYEARSLGGMQAYRDL